MVSTPIIGATPSVRIIIHFKNSKINLEQHFSSFEFKAMMNGGYLIRAEIFDPHFNIYSEFIKKGYHEESRQYPIVIEFQIQWSKQSLTPPAATKIQYAILTSLGAHGDSGDIANIVLYGVDPPSWYLNIGDAAGTVWKGRVDQVIRNVVKKYAPKINVEVSKTVDSDQNKWWMMRQDPKTFISSLTDWSSSITQKKTHWLISPDGYNLTIKEQAQWTSRQRAYYSSRPGGGDDPRPRSNINNWEYLSDNALSIVQTKLIAQGAGALSGHYLDRVSDKSENAVFAKDSTTVNKQIAKTNPDQSFMKPSDTPGSSTPLSGWSSISSVPEIYSAGELGLRYDEYIDGRPRGMWLNLMNNLMRVKLEVIGHGEWSDCNGLGVDTVFIKWTQAPKTETDNPYWWMSGNWIVYGFHHRVTRRSWDTDVYCARFDYNAAAVKVGAGR